MVFVAAAPLCGWFLAAYLSSTVGALDSKTEESTYKLRTTKGRRRAQYMRSLSCSFSGSSARCSSPVGGRTSRNSGGINAARLELSSSWSSSIATESLLSRKSTVGLKARNVGNQKSNNYKTYSLPGKIAAIAAVQTSETPKKTVEKTAVKERRVVVTGLGVVSCLGHDAQSFYDNLLAGNSGISHIEGFDVSDYPTKIAGEIKEFSHAGYVNPKMARRMDKFMQYMLTAGKKALEDAGLDSAALAALDKAKCGILIGSAMGGMQVFHDAIEALKVSYRKMNPFCIPFVTTNMGSAMLAMDLGWMGPNYSISTACATGNYCILSAANHIKRGEADVMLCGGSDAAILPIGLGGFVACRALSKRNDEPQRASRPWDQNRDGFVMGEGAGVLLLEELEHAKARGAPILAEFLGGSFTCDAYHMTEPHPDGLGVAVCLEKALESSGVRREDVNYVNAHATSTPAGDLQEYKALLRVFGQNKGLKMNSTKSMIGHLLGAAGAVEAVATVQAIRTGYVHPNLNVEDPEKEVDLGVIVGPQKEKLDINVALSNSFGFGGHNSSILFAPFKEEGYKPSHG